MHSIYANTCFITTLPDIKLSIHHRGIAKGIACLVLTLHRKAWENTFD